MDVYSLQDLFYQLRFVNFRRGSTFAPALMPHSLTCRVVLVKFSFWQGITCLQPMSVYS